MTFADIVSGCYRNRPIRSTAILSTGGKIPYIQLVLFQMLTSEFREIIKTYWFGEFTNSVSYLKQKINSYQEKKIKNCSQKKNDFIISESKTKSKFVRSEPQGVFVLQSVVWNMEQNQCPNMNQLKFLYKEMIYSKYEKLSWCTVLLLQSIVSLNIMITLLLILELLLVLLAELESRMKVFWCNIYKQDEILWCCWRRVGF